MLKRGLFPQIGYFEAIDHGLAAMDNQALALCMDHIMRVACGEKIGTIVK